MTSEVLFEEIQPSGNKKLRDFFGIMSILFGLALLFHFYLKGFRMDYTGTGLLCGLVFCVLFRIISFTRLITQITVEGIQVRFPPFQPRFVLYRWEDLLDVHLRHFDALSEYGGWGMKLGPMGKGYIISGNTGIQLVLKNKKRILISTRQPNEVAAVLKGLGRFL